MSSSLNDHEKEGPESEKVERSKNTSSTEKKVGFKKEEVENEKESKEKTKSDLKEIKIPWEEEFQNSNSSDKIQETDASPFSPHAGILSKDDENTDQVTKENSKKNERKTSKSESKCNLRERDVNESTEGDQRKSSVSESELYEKEAKEERNNIDFSDTVGRLISYEEKIKSDTFFQKLSVSRPVDEFDDQKKVEDVSREEKLTAVKASILSLAAIIGAGFNELPGALQKSGWYGVFIILLVGVDALYAGMCIGWCWIIIEERWPDCRADDRSPYPTIALKAVGKWMKFITTFCMQATLLSSCIAYLSLVSAAFVEILNYKVNVCVMMLVVAILSMPFVSFVKLRKIWWMGVITLCSSLLLFVLVIGALFADKMKFGNARYSDTSMNDLGRAFGVVAFAFGGGGVHPTIQNEMESKKYFPQAVATSYLMILLLYVPLPILGYAAYGLETERNILRHFRGNEDLNITKGFLLFLSACHLAATMVIYFNPIFQNIEDILNLSKKFDWKVCCARVSALVFILIMGLAMPFFGTLLPFIGAFLVTFVSIVLPPIFYISLVQQKNDDFPERRISIKEWIMLIQTIGIGILAGCYATYASFGIWWSEELHWSCLDHIP